MTPEEIQKRIEQSIQGAKAEVVGADNHYDAVIIAEAFAGKTLIERHQMIYALFRGEMADQRIHALSLKTSTPEERRSDSAQRES